ncbi:MAG: hypothetical protein H6818_04785 [Phycisphaerales bacterium]|nr:hypothetical protein [Phycisphaerales bacterium]
MAAMIAAGALTQGCGTGLTLDSTLADALNVLTSGDLASAFDAFVNSAGSTNSGLTDDQIAGIEDLQAQLDAGQIDAEAFSSAVGVLVGDRAPGMAFGGFEYGGGPFGMHGIGRLGNLLDLTDEQKADAEVIFTTLHETIHNLRTQAMEDIRAELTEEQLATLDSLRPGHPMDDAEGAGARFRGPRPHGPGSLASHFAELLNLTDEQSAAIDGIRSALRDAVRAEHETAREAFRALLTEEQLAALDAFEQVHGHGADELDGESIDG